MISKEEFEKYMMGTGLSDVRRKAIINACHDGYHDYWNAPEKRYEYAKRMLEEGKTVPCVLRELHKTYDNDGLVFSSALNGDYNNEVFDAFQTVGVMIRAKINRLCNNGLFIEAQELENALKLINNTDYNN